MQQFHLDRVDLRDRIERDYSSGDSGWLGEETRWLINVASVVRCLAAPGGTHEFIRAPQSGEGHPGGGPAYWGSLLHLLVYSFGWSSPGHGIAWWVRAGRPTDDDRFALMEQVWVADGQFDWFCAWLWTRQPRFRPHTHTHGTPVDEIAHGRPDIWFQAVAHECERSGAPEPFGGGADPLHLHHHLDNFWDGYQHRCTLVLDAAGGAHGVVLAEDLMSWAEFLRTSVALAQEHPSGRSWRIDVVVKSVGWLGTYRRSRETGRWFAGPHRYHIVGNPT